MENGKVIVTITEKIIEIENHFDYLNFHNTNSTYLFKSIDLAKEFLIKNEFEEIDGFNGYYFKNKNNQAFIIKIKEE